MKNYESENAQFNTMVCKESVNLTGERKKAEAAGAVPLQCPVLFGGGRRAKRDSMYHKTDEIVQESFSVRISEHNPLGQGRPRYFAATELTSMVSPFKVPVTVAVLPACLSRVASTVLSAVSRL